MRILQILHDHERGGVQALAAMIETGLSPHGFTFESDYLYPRPGLSVVAKLGCVASLVRNMWRGKYDALIAYQSTASVLVGVIGWLRGCRLRVVHQTCVPHETPLPVRLMDMLAGALGLYSANIVNSAATWAAYARYPARYRRSTVLIEHGLDSPSPSRSREETRRRFDLPRSAQILLNVGRLAAQKNQDVLIRALACLPKSHLVLAGAGLKMVEFRELAVTLGVDDRLHMLGALPSDDIADLYAAADLFVFPSTWETFGLAPVEAAMVGVPMAVADLPVLREVLHTNEPAPVAFVAPFDVEGWISSIQTMLATPRPQLVVDKFARAIARKYSLQRMIESYLSLFTAHRQTERVEVTRLQPAAGKSRS
jgi:glycosyltransferase involved in cell wall biosynthesis